MSDLLSTAGSIVGIVSLGITLSQGLCDYYAAYQEYDTDIATASKKLRHLLHVFQALHDGLRQRQFGADDRVLCKEISSCIEDCSDLVTELETELAKLSSTPSRDTIFELRHTGRRLLYPFRKSTLQKLSEDIDSIVSCLSLAMQLLSQKGVVKLEDDMEDVKGLLSLVRASQISSDIKVWLRAPDASANFNEAIQKKHPNTGLWFVKSSDFATWLIKPNSLLWLVGFSGCGKSILCSTATQFIYRHRRGNSEIGIGFFYFTFNDETKQSASDMLRALVLQLSSQLTGDEHDLLLQLGGNCRSAAPSNQSLMAYLHRIVQSFREVYIVLDALDESPRDTHRDAVLQTVVDIRSWSVPGLHLMVSSRDEVDIREHLNVTSTERIEMRNGLVDQDIALFISQTLRDNRRLQKWADYHGKIEGALATRAQGVFRWVDCQFRALANCPESEDLLDQVLDTLPPTLDETYARMLSQIPSYSVDYARQMLTLLCYARRPLTVDELIVGIAFQQEQDPQFNPKRILRNENAIQEVCPGLVEVDVDPFSLHKTVRLAHFSVREYLISGRLAQQTNVSSFCIESANAERHIACICLIVLLNLGEQAEPPFHQFDGSLLAGYAAQYWPDHFRSGQVEPIVEGKAFDLFIGSHVAFETWRAILDVDSYGGKASPGKLIPPLYYASLLGLEVIAVRLVEKGADVNAQGGYYGTALYAASHEGHVAIVQLLLEYGADFNAQGRCPGTALYAASGEGHERIVQILLRKGADTNTKDEYFGTPLHAASCWGHATIVKLLLERGADITIQDRAHTTALYLAAERGHEVIFQLLLERGANVNVRGGDHNTPLQAAAFHGHTTIVQLLLENGADVNAKDGQFGTALQSASFQGHETVVQLLIEKDVDINAQYGEFGTALQAASECGCEKIVQLLLEKGADINAHNAQHGFFEPALHQASSNGHEVIVRLLLDNGADVNFQGGTYHTALIAASFFGHETVVQLLLNEGADIHAQSDLYGTALQAASYGGNGATIQLLLHNGADVNAQGGRYHTALIESSYRGSKVITELLLRNGADIHAQSDYYGTAMQAASEMGHGAIVKLLLGNSI